MISLIHALAIASLLVCCVDAASLRDDHHSHRFLKGQKSLGKTTCDPKFSSMFVFGDSLSDQGNLASVAGIPLIKPGFFSNGRVAVEYIADEFGLELEMSNHLIAGFQNNLQLITGTNYAVATANASPGDMFSTSEQMTAFMAKHEGDAPSDALYFVFIGGNDVVRASYDSRYRPDKEEVFDPTITEKEVRTKLRKAVKSIIELLVQPLIDAGARNIVVMDAPPAQDTPYVTLRQPEERAKNVERAVAFFNNELKEALHVVECLNDMNIVHYQKIATIFTDAEKLGFQTKTPCVINFLGVPGGDPAIPPLIGNETGPQIWDQTCTLPDATGFAFYDEFHPTTAIHKVFAELVVDQIRAEICPDKRMNPSTKACKTSKTKDAKTTKSPKGKKSDATKDAKTTKSAKGKKSDATKDAKTTKSPKGKKSNARE